ncbi:MAG TPA: membrane protein insertase YidC [Syntrophales bacterium]|nr:membrane protein insertase YidC [Syntrophales bacterium]HOU77569.1 membrane protein insertase YidC [Syntrophales bacterium]
MDKRTILAIVLSVAVILIYQLFFVKPPVKPTAVPSKEAVQAEKKDLPAPPPAASLPRAQQPAGKAAAMAAAVPERFITVETPLYSARFTTKGGALQSFKLKGYRQKLNAAAEPIEMVNVSAGMPRPLTLSFPGSSFDPPGEGMFDSETKSLDLTGGRESRQLILRQTVADTMKIEKIFTFYPDRYAIDLEVRAANLTAVPLTQNASLNWSQYVDPKEETDSWSHKGPIAFVAKDIERIDVKKIDGGKTLGPNVTWGGFESKYFIAAVIPQNPSLTSFAITRDNRDLVTVGLQGPKALIPGGQSDSFVYTLFIGPKDYTILKAQNVQLENAIDFGSWLKWLAMPLLIVLKWLYQYVHNYGIAIIILTILIKVIFWPLGNKSYESMKKMQKLQPKMKELQEKYKTDRQKLSQETMALYRTHKINPMSGCLPMLIQIPVFFGLYKTLLYAIELRHSPFYWWIQDLSEKDPYYITPIIMGGTMWLQQKMTPVGGDPMQQKIMLWMPVIFTFLFLNFPSGLVIYWLFNNIISIGQQYYINKRHS